MGQLRVVAGLGRDENCHGTRDVLLEQLGQLIACGLAVERLDRVADVDLIPQQSTFGRREVGIAAREADDRQARPGDVLLPQFPHAVVEGQLLGCLSRHRGAVAMLVTSRRVTFARARDRQHDDHASEREDAGERQLCATVGMGIGIHRSTS